MGQLIPTGWDTSKEATGRVCPEGKPIMGATLSKGLNDKNPDGTYSPCDEGVSEIIQGVTHLEMNRGRMGELRFGDNGSSNKFLVKIKDKELKGLSFQYMDADGEAMVVVEGKPQSVFSNGIVIKSTPFYKGVRMDIIVNDPLTAPTEYTFSSKTYGQDYSVIEENGGLTFRGDDLVPIYIGAPYAEDANGEYGEVTIRYLGVENNLHIFKKVVDGAWLRQAASPVRIDPSVTIEDGVDGGVIVDAVIAAGGFLNFNFGARVNMNLQDYTGSSEQCWVIGATVTGLGIGTVTLAKYLLNADSVVGSVFNCELRQLKRNWNEGNKNATAASTGEVTAASARHNEEAWTTTCARGAGTDYDDVAITASFTSPSSTGAYEIIMDTAIWQARVDGGTNYGDVCHPVSYTSSKGVRTETSESSNKPQLYIEYTEDVGSPHYYYAQLQQ